MKIIKAINHDIFESYNGSIAKNFLLNHASKAIFDLVKDSERCDSDFRRLVFYHQKKISKTEVLRVTDLDNDVKLFKERYVYFKN